MGTQQRAMGHSPGLLWVVLTTVLISFGSPANILAQSSNSNIRLKVASPKASGLSAASSEGLPERGEFQFRYSYNGESIDADIILFKNGSEVARASGLSPVTNKLLADFSVKKGDVIVISTSFRGSGNSATLGPSNIFGHPAGLWYSYGSGSFYSIDQEGNIIEVFGNWNFSLTLRPPWNGITVEAQPSQLSPGGASNISLQPIESPDEPVIIPDQTYINLQTNVVGDLLGGLGLPDFSLRYTQGFANAPWGLLKGADKVFEVLPDSLLPVQFDSLQVPIVAYSPYDTGVNGSTDIEVTKEGEELNLNLDIAGKTEAWPTLTSGTASGGDANTTPNPNERNKIKKIIIKVTKDGNPVSGKSIRTLAQLELPSGGHQHTNQPTKMDLGKFKDFSNEKESFGLINSVTDEKGEVILEYTTSQISGEFKISSILTGSSGVNDSEKVLVSVEPDLLNFASLGTERWNLTGNTGTTSYSKCDGTQINHAQNHYASQKLYGNLYNALIDFYEWSGMPRSEGGYGEFIKVGLNDMSLPKGGLFDICSDWGGGNKKEGHYYHRIGASVDVDTRGRTITDNELVYLLNEELPDGTTIQEKLKFFVNNHGGEKYPEATIHYGFGGN